jgi:NRPS condensation-like uncharacterized protein
MPSSAVADDRLQSATSRPLDPFEHLMLTDARPEHPLCFFVECDVEGVLDEDRLRAAVDAAARRHPLVRCRVGWRVWRPHWLEPDVAPALLWYPAAGDRPWRTPDITAESGVRLVVLSGDAPDRHRVILQVQHAVCDGLAAMEFLGDVWAGYAGLEPPSFSTRRRPDDTAASAPKTTSADMRRDAVAFSRFRPRPLAPLRGTHEGTRVARLLDPPYLAREFDRDTTARLRRGATARGITLNDVVVTATMRAAIEWNERAGSETGDVRINVPVSLRPPGTRQPARNVLGYAFLDRIPEACRDRERLAASIAEATRWILATNAAAEFLVGLRAVSRVPGLLRLLTRLPVCHATGVVSWVGDPSRRMRSGVGKIDGRDAPGGVVIRGIWGVPPLRPRTRVAIGATTYAGTLALCCTCSAGTDHRDASARFLDLVQPELEAFAD